MILDACFVIDLLADDPGAVAKLDEIDHHQLVIPTPVYVEVGLGFDPGSSESEIFEEVMQQVTLAPFDSEAARRCVDLQRDLYREGRPLSAVDAMIGGQALSRDAPIVTRNVEDFGRVPVRVSPY